MGDAHPSIKVVEAEDSVSRGFDISGNIGDDYGFSKLVFCYKTKNEVLSKALDCPKQFCSIFHTWNIVDLGLSPGDVVEYWFEVWDNDRVNGVKSSKTSIKFFYSIRK